MKVAIYRFVIVCAVSLGIFGLLSLTGQLLTGTVISGLIEDARLSDNSAGIVCSTAFLYNYQAGAPDITENTVNRLEQLARDTCSSEEIAARKTTNHRNPDGTAKHAVLLEGEACIVNWELTPKAHKTAVEDICINRNPQPP